MAPAKVGWLSRFKRSLACRSSLSDWANKQRTFSRSIRSNSPKPCLSRPDLPPLVPVKNDADTNFMAEALRLARRAFGLTSPNPMVGALLVKQGQVIGRGWHHRAGESHAEIEALRD